MKLTLARRAGLLTLALFPFMTPTDVKAEIPACAHGIALLHNDAHAWLTLQNQLSRLKKNVAHIRTEISDVIDINDDIGKADKTAADIHKVLSRISPLFELAPSLQSGLDKTSRAAEISHKDVLGPIHTVTNKFVTVAKLREIKAELDAKVLPKIGEFEKDALAAHLKSVKFGGDYVEACHIAATIKTKACISSGNKAIEAVYNDFNNPVRLLDTAVMDLASGIGTANRIMETEIFVGMKPLIDIHRPVVDVSKAIAAVEREIRKLEHAMRRHIHIHVGPLKLKFTINHLLKEWKIELKKFEHLIHIDKLKAAMRRAVEKALHHIIHDIQKFIHKLEPKIHVHGFDLAKLDAELKKLFAELAFKGVRFDLSAFDLAIKGLNVELPKLKKCT